MRRLDIYPDFLKASYQECSSYLGEIDSHLYETVASSWDLCGFFFPFLANNF
jgi:hypothetical protein